MCLSKEGTVQGASFQPGQCTLVNMPPDTANRAVSLSTCLQTGLALHLWTVNTLQSHLPLALDRHLCSLLDVAVATVAWCHASPGVTVTNSLVPKLSRAPRTKNSLVTIVDFLGPKSSYQAEFVLANITTGDNFSTRDTRGRHRFTAAPGSLLQLGETRSTSRLLRVNTKSHHVVSLMEPDSHAQRKNV